MLLSGENLKQDILDVVMDWLACGIDPKKSTIYVQSLVPETAELHIYLSMITPQNWVERDPTLKDMAKILKSKEGMASQINYGLMGYPVLMTADILTFNADCVPVGIDQVAHVELTRDIVRRINNVSESFKDATMQELYEIGFIDGKPSALIMYKTLGEVLALLMQ